MSEPHSPRLRAQDRTVLLTGAAGGMGRAFARRLVHDGFAVVLADLAPVAPLAQALEAQGGRVLAAQVDLADPAAIERLCDAAERFAPAGVDSLVNNAAYMGLAMFADLSLAELRRYLQVNIEAPFQLASRLLPGMVARGFGRVVNLVSSSAWTPAPGFTGYITSKMAMIGMTRTMAVEYGRHGITVNAMTPGLTGHENNRGTLPDEMFQAMAQRQAIPRPATAGDAVGTLAFLLSDDAAFMTGQTLVVDGGMVYLP